MDKKKREEEGHLYEVVSRCRVCGAVVVAPRWWASVRAPRPWYATCRCFDRMFRLS